jgi:hypothetical protein
VEESDLPATISSHTPKTNGTKRTGLVIHQRLLITLYWLIFSLFVHTREVAMPDGPVFADEQFMSGAEKKKVLRAWNRFLKNACVKSQFTEDLYVHLTQHCSFIAHFDRHGFYNFYFERMTESVFRFFDQFDPQKPGISAEYGATYWLSKHNTGADLSHAMREAAGPFLQGLRQTFAEAKRQQDIAVASHLLAAHGLVIAAATASVASADVNPMAPRPSVGGSVQQELFTD